jgi:hypothetical protein
MMLLAEKIILARLVLAAAHRPFIHFVTYLDIDEGALTALQLCCGVFFVRPAPVRSSAHDSILPNYRDPQTGHIFVPERVLFVQT